MVADGGDLVGCDDGGDGADGADGDDFVGCDDGGDAVSVDDVDVSANEFKRSYVM